MTRINYFKTFSILLCLFVSFQSIADEGMWPLIFIKRLNQENLKKMGLKLTADEIYSVNHSSLKDAVVSISGGSCTAEIISKDGLMLTNHHCGYDAIQSHSSVENDYLTDGFWAKTHSEEKPNPDMYISFLVRMEDVTSKVVSKVTTNATESDRSAEIAKLSDQIIVEATKGTHYNADVKSFFEGNEYYLFVYETYRDVRLAGAPPSSIGKFGGDVDNWMWPRHTGDFSLFRIYASPDGSPSAGYDTKNIPLKAKYHLPISLNGVNKNDFTMVMGYPGTTNRYLTSLGVKQTLEILNPSRIKLREKRLAIYKEDMDASKEVKIKYASKYATISNYWKFFIGESEGLRKLKIYNLKKKEENAFMKWANSNEQTKKKYGEVFTNIEQAYGGLDKYMKFNVYLNEAIFAPEILSIAYKSASLFHELSASPVDKEKLEIAIQSSKDMAKEHFKDYNLATDKKLLSAMLSYIYSDLPKDQQPEIMVMIDSKYKGNFNRYVDDLFASSIFSTQEQLNAFLSKPTFKVIDGDAAFNLMRAFLGTYFDKISPQLEASNELLDASNRLYIQGLREMKQNKIFYPNANSTMRINFGKVLDYYPKDAVHYDQYTTLEGIMEKEDSTNEDFSVPARLKDLYMKKDYGQYGASGKMKVCFISDNDITGGNSGSPVINGKGQLVGLAFDGNWEAMSGNIAYEPRLQRCIAVDIRYVLFVIDKYAGASNLIKEMTLVKSK